MLRGHQKPIAHSKHRFLTKLMWNMSVIRPHKTWHNLDIPAKLPIFEKCQTEISSRICHHGLILTISYSWRQIRFHSDKIIKSQVNTTGSRSSLDDITTSSRHRYLNTWYHACLIFWEYISCQPYWIRWLHTNITGPHTHAEEAEFLFTRMMMRLWRVFSDKMRIQWIQRWINSSAGLYEGTGDVL